MSIFEWTPRQTYLTFLLNMYKIRYLYPHTTAYISLVIYQVYLYPRTTGYLSLVITGYLSSLPLQAHLCLSIYYLCAVFDFCYFSLISAKSLSFPSCEVWEVNLTRVSGKSTWCFQSLFSMVKHVYRMPSVAPVISLQPKNKSTLKYRSHSQRWRCGI